MDVKLMGQMFKGGGGNVNNVFAECNAVCLPKILTFQEKFAMQISHFQTVTMCVCVCVFFSLNMTEIDLQTVYQLKLTSL